VPRPCQRVLLESGLKLDLNWLARRGFVQQGAVTGPIGIQWTAGDGELIASAIIAADMRGPDEGWLRVKSFRDGGLDQRIILEARPRHFGGRQWFFLCPYLNRRATVLWMPPGARAFACRQRWGRQVVYASDLLDRDNRAQQGQAKIRARLCAAGGFDPDEWDFPPKPKWMRWRTYRLAEAKFDRYSSVQDEGVVELAAKLGMKL
jgi:hypothetical protein